MSLDQPSELVKHQSLTRDAFLGGRLTVTQPRHGFRAGLDSVLLGASVDPASRTVLDLGAGVGTAGLVALTYNPDASAVLVEDNAEMLALAEQNGLDNSMDARLSVLALDVVAKGAMRRAAGLPTDYFGTVIANPPFFSVAGGTLARDVGRAGSRHMSPPSLDLWVKTAAASAAPGGEIIFIYPADGLAPLLAGFDQRFGAITLLPLSPRDGEPTTRLLIRAIKGSRAPLTLLATRALHGTSGRDFTPEFDAILRGLTRLIW